MDKRGRGGISARAASAIGESCRELRRRSSLKVKEVGRTTGRGVVVLMGDSEKARGGGVVLKLRSIASSCAGIGGSGEVGFGGMKEVSNSGGRMSIGDSASNSGEFSSIARKLGRSEEGEGRVNAH